jgi:hypothetical protein
MSDMSDIKPAEVTSQVVDLLSPLESEDRQRVVRAAMMLLGESPMVENKGTGGADPTGVGGEGGSTIPQKALIWMKQNAVTMEQLQQAFHIDGGDAVVIAAEIPGANKKEKTLNAYVLAGISRLLSAGEPAFDDKSARALCVSSGCFDTSNHAATMKDKGNAFTGSKASGWTLTAPGLKQGADLVKGIGASK